MPYITKDGKPFKAFTTFAKAWLECFDQGFVVPRHRVRRPGEAEGQRGHRLAPGIHVIDERLLKPKGGVDPTLKPKRNRWSNSKKRNFKVQNRKEQNWIDEL